ncbi:hypothetical protein DPMN_050481 [Dreissena polymorpha]|uniref:Uncharacterized protein n=1 Tax=Dreissena polymorpha TaxID=45954 RepID=A0A9D4CHL7_DREPO|nr:hypothetical protein DPMN_050481 [Dreissena polymorpha]
MNICTCTCKTDKHTHPCNIHVKRQLQFLRWVFTVCLHGVTADKSKVTTESHDVTADIGDVTEDSRVVTADGRYVTTDFHDVTAGGLS